MAQMVKFSQRNLWQAIHGKSMKIFLTLWERREFGLCTRLPSWKDMILLQWTQKL